MGYATALDMMLTGKNIKPDKAKKMGLVDLVVDPAALEAVIQFLYQPLLVVSTYSMYLPYLGRNTAGKGLDCGNSKALQEEERLGIVLHGGNTAAIHNVFPSQEDGDQKQWRPLPCTICYYQFTRKF